MYYQAILWDVDGTLLDFEKSERHGILSCMEEFGIEGCDDAMLGRYAEVKPRLLGSAGARRDDETGSTGWKISPFLCTGGNYLQRCKSI